ncbi:MAG: EutN/CcmL family microcompartment protein [Deltaproteobacteria bacterium]|nr:EutN/CcmL family microcompartment protein [Deltaproteobacteria bacterium]
MNIGKVVGTVVASRKEPKLDGLKLMLVQQADLSGGPKGSHVVAVDAVGAGMGELVLYCSGSSARQTEVTQNRPVDTVIMAIVDEIESDGKTSFRK